MCGRFVSAEDAEILQAQWELAVISDAARSVRPSWNIPPTDTIRLIVNIDEQFQLHAGRWGLLPRWVKDPSSFPTLFNARSETIDTTRSFAPLITTSRCLIPATGYYEWQKHSEQAKKSAKSQPVFIHPVGAPETRKPVAFAGLYSWWKETPAADDWQLTCTIITRQARPELADIHHREAILLDQELGRQWLHPHLGNEQSSPTPDLTPDAITSFLARATTDLGAYPVDTRVGSVSSNGPELITPLSSS